MFPGNLIIVLYSICVSSASLPSCDVRDFGSRESNFQLYNNLQLDGCQAVSKNRNKISTQLSCALECLDTDCAGFNFTSATSMCVTCAGIQTQKLSFSVEEDIMLQRRAVITDASFEETTNLTGFFHSLPCQLKAGSIIRFSGKYLGEDGLTIAGGSTHSFDVNFLLRAHPGSAVEMIYSKEGSGANVPTNMTEFPFVVDQDTHVFILVRQDKFIVYIDGAWCCEMEHVVSLDELDYLALVGSVQLYEFSF